MSAGFRRHLVGKTLRNIVTVTSLKYDCRQVYEHTDIFLNQLIQCYWNNMINVRALTAHIQPCCTHKMAIAL